MTKNRKLKKSVWVEPKYLRSIGDTKVYWRCHACSYGVHADELRVGMKGGWCEHAMESFQRGKLPAKSRFIAATIDKIENGLMTVKFDKPGSGPLSVTCGIKEYSMFFILRSKP